MNDRNLANTLHRLESILYRESNCDEEMKRVHEAFRMMKVNNKNTKDRAKSFTYAMETIEDFMDTYDINEYTNYVMERVYLLLT